MSNELYVKMTDAEYESFKQMKKLEQYTPGELASALLTSIKERNGNYDKQYNVISNRPRTSAQIREGQFLINIQVDEL